MVRFFGVDVMSSVMEKHTSPEAFKKLGTLAGKLAITSWSGLHVDAVAASDGDSDDNGKSAGAVKGSALHIWLLLVQ